MSGFYKLTPAISKQLRDCKLTAAEWKVWSYLVAVDPYGDRYKDIDLLVLLQECKVSKATFYRAIAKLQEAEIFDVQTESISVRNLRGVTSLRNETGVSELRLDSHFCDKSIRNETGVSELRLDSHFCENEPPEPLLGNGSESPQTLKTLKTFKTSSEAGWEELKKFSEKLRVYSIYTELKNEDDQWFQNPKLESVARFLGESSEDLRSQSIKQFLSWIDSQRNIRNIYSVFYVSLKNFLGKNDTL